MTAPTFQGSICALITPFNEDRVAEAEFQRFVAWQLDEGTDAVVACGTTGESPTVSHAENKRIIDLAVEVCKGRAPVIAGTGSNATSEAIDLTRHAAASGADAALVVSPYYNKPSQEGLYQHFKAVHDSVDIPIIVYNIPGRSVVDVTTETLARLAELPRVVGVKDSTGDVQRPYRIRQAIEGEFAQLSGEDACVLPYLAMGGDGCISVTANVAPRLLSEMHRAWRKNDVATAQKINDQLMPLHDAMFCEPSPSPAKYGATLLGFGNETVRLPMVPCTDTARERVYNAMQSLGLLG